jgi:hypothetical protein
MFKKAALHLVATLFIAGNVFPQQPFQGTIVDSKTKSPISYASIKVKNKKIQSVANADGRFSLSSDIFLLQDTIIISCVGYLSKSVPINTIEVSPVIKLQSLMLKISLKGKIRRAKSSFFISPSQQAIVRK